MSGLGLLPYIQNKKKPQKKREILIFTKYKILIYKLKIWWIHLWMKFIFDHCEDGPY